MALSLVLPCYNEEANVEATVREVLAWMRERGIEGEVVAVDDGSRDGTAARLERLAAAEPRLRVVRHERNRGYGDAVRTGCDAAQEELIAFMDADGQFRVRDLELLLARAQEVPFVAGRRERRADPLVRSVLGKVLAATNAVCFGLVLRDVNCGMKLFRRSVWRAIRPPGGLEKFFNAMLYLRAREKGIPWGQVAVPHYPRVHGAPTGAKPSVIAKMRVELATIRAWRREIAREALAERAATARTS